MSEKNTVRRSVTSTTRSWRTLDKLTPEQRTDIEKMMADGEIDGATVTQKWHEAGTGKDDFSAEMKDGVVTVNGRRYSSLEEVPAEDRRRIEALRASMSAGGSLMKMLDEATAEARNRDLSGQGTHPHDVSTPGANLPGMATTAYVDASSPGAVPVAGAGRRIGQLLLVVVCIGAAWLIARALNLV